VLNKYDHLLLVREASQITRWHTKRTLRTQSIAEHTFGVVSILTTIHPGASSHLLMAALVHDLAELETGDVPAPVKWANPKLKDALTEIEDRFHARTSSHYKLTPKEEHMLKWADMMELVLWCIEEVDMGNQGMGNTARIGMAHLSTLGPPNEAATDLFNDVVVTLRLLNPQPL
jgi:5'-deoxynucleotidase YfbR-like HD superfamily hydrolase